VILKKILLILLIPQQLPQGLHCRLSSASRRQRRLQASKIVAEAAEAKDDLGVPVSSPYSEKQQDTAVQIFRKHQVQSKTQTDDPRCTSHTTTFC
jgi:hypothetical protein